ncbi:MAG: MFS transporter [Deltaproteobacteria bacterium]|nr:MFS transporter [Deltaproteobacteria bacterium]
MLAKIKDRNVRVVYASIFLLGIAYGVPIALSSLVLAKQGFSKQDIGTLAAFFAGGIVALSLPMGAIIQRFSARRTLIVALLGYAVAVGSFPYIRSYPQFAALRVVDGMCSVGIWVACETILLSRADRTHKAYIVSLYAIAMGLGYVIGPVMAHTIAHFADMKYAFVVAGVLSVLSAFVVVSQLEQDTDLHAHVPAELDPAESSLDYRTMAHVPQPAPRSMDLLARIRTSCFATFAYGYFQSSVVLFLPLYLIESKHIPESRTILVPAFFAAGMLVLSNLTARVGDARGHLLLMRALGAVGTVMVLGFIWIDSFWGMCAAVFVAGSTLASISPVSLALQGVVVAQRDYTRANAIYNAFYAAGMLLGPIISGALFTRYGGVSMLGHLALLWAAFVVFATIYRMDDPVARTQRVSTV